MNTNNIKRYSFFNAIVLLVFCLTPVAAIASTFSLSAYPEDSNTIILKWTSSSEENFDIWITKSGKQWQKVSSQNLQYNYSVGTEVYQYSATVTEGIGPYQNYYFAVTIKDSVNNYLEEATELNSSNEAIAYPPHKMAHGYFTKATNTCAYCHSFHNGQAPKLLSFSTVNDSCISCHDGTGSKYNIINGTVDKNGLFSDPLKSNSGPFGSILNRNSTAAPMSIHSLDQPINTAPGGNYTNQELAEPLGCGSCHDPHFNGNYRSLRTQLPGSINVKVKAYAETNLNDNKEDPFYVSGINQFCKGCHSDYMANSGSANIPANGTYQSDGKYRHSVGVSIQDYYKGPLTTSLSLQGPVQDNNYISCVTCHFAHGSENKTNDFSNYLLRRDFRGVCEDCHKK